jgi:hypothetical protein
MLALWDGHGYHGQGATSRAKASRCDRTLCVESSTAARASDFFLVERGRDG